MLYEEEIHSNIVTYKSFLPFWDKIFDTNNIFQSCMYQQMIITLFNLIDKLDLSIQDDGYFNLQNNIAQNQNDFRIFINIVDFYCYILILNDHLMFENYANMYFEKLIHYSLKNPLISGFYKLIGIGLTLICKMENKNCLDGSCSLLLNTYLFRILIKYQEYKDDLQLSMIQLILACPIYLLMDHLQYLPNVINTALDIGQTYLNIALKTIDVMENWCRDLTNDQMELIFTSIMPNLDKFLKTRSNNDEFSEQLSKISTTKSKKLANKRITLKIDPDLMILQQKILTLLGLLF